MCSYTSQSSNISMTVNETESLISKMRGITPAFWPASSMNNCIYLCKIPLVISIRWDIPHILLLNCWVLFIVPL